MIDTHCHVDFKDFNKDREEVIKRAKKNLSAIINSGATLGGNRRVLKLVEEYKGFIHGTLGFHPVDASKADNSIIDEAFKEIHENIDKVVAVGETGLDFYHIDDNESRKRQIKMFKSFIEIANEYDKPIVIHARDAELKAFELIKKYSKDIDAVFHCYGGDLKTANKIVDECHYISFSTIICYSKYHKELVENIPLEYVLTETDSPYLSPFKGQRNEPVNVEETVKKIAEIKSISIGKVDNITEKNAKNVFGI
ncbi:MAG: TatD family hydrolase [Methanobacterium sp.]|uniref:TatD family hydrolase n=1 Tax=Methanobacterium sp. TaxID=2164 RepID=UPI003D64DADE|nr:TatD family hydrolase [Methanobacterium sp.]